MNIWVKNKNNENEDIRKDVWTTYENKKNKKMRLLEKS